MAGEVTELDVEHTVLRTGAALEDVEGNKIAPAGCVDFQTVAADELRGFHKNCRFMSCDWEQHDHCRGTEGALERAKARVKDSPKPPDQHVYRAHIEMLRAVPKGTAKQMVEAWHWPEEQPNQAHTHLVLRETLNRPERGTARLHVQLCLRPA